MVPQNLNDSLLSENIQKKKWAKVQKKEEIETARNVRFIRLFGLREKTQKPRTRKKIVGIITPTAVVNGVIFLLE